jgi:hypothetical protein
MAVRKLKIPMKTSTPLESGKVWLVGAGPGDPNC